MDDKVLVEITFSGKNFGAHVPLLPGCVATGEGPTEIMHNIKDAINFHVESSIEDNDPIDDVFKHEYELKYRFDVVGLLNYFKGIFTNSALERITGINQKQIQHYAAGLKRPRAAQAQKIENALHNLGAELLKVEVIH